MTSHFELDLDADDDAVIADESSYKGLLEVYSLGRESNVVTFHLL